MRGKTSAVQNAKQKTETKKNAQKGRTYPHEIHRRKKIVERSRNQSAKSGFLQNIHSGARRHPHPQRRKPPHFDRLRS